MPWKDKTKEKAWRREYYHRHREQARARSLRYRRDHPEQVKRDPEQAKRAWRRASDEKTELVDNIKRKLRCAMCGQSFPDCPSVMDFHHEGKESKSDGVAQLVGHHAPDEAILAEIAKCIPLCANCHRKVHILE